MPRDEIDDLVERIAEAVVKKIDERQKVDLLAEAVLAKIQEWEEAEESLPSEDTRDEGALERIFPKSFAKRK